MSIVSHLKLGIGYWQCKALDRTCVFLLLGSVVSASKFGHMNQLPSTIPSGKRLQSEYMNALCDKARSGEYDVERLKSITSTSRARFLTSSIITSLSFFLSVCLCVCLSVALSLSLARSLVIITRSPTTSRWIYTPQSYLLGEGVTSLGKLLTRFYWGKKLESLNLVRYVIRGLRALCLS